MGSDENFGDRRTGRRLGKKSGGRLAKKTAGDGDFGYGYQWNRDLGDAQGGSDQRCYGRKCHLLYLREIDRGGRDRGTHRHCDGQRHAGRIDTGDGTGIGHGQFIDTGNAKCHMFKFCHVCI